MVEAFDLSEESKESGPPPRKKVDEKRSKKLSHENSVTLGYTYGGERMVPMIDKSGWSLSLSFMKISWSKDTK